MRFGIAASLYNQSEIFLANNTTIVIKFKLILTSFLCVIAIQFSHTQKFVDVVNNWYILSQSPSSGAEIIEAYRFIDTIDTIINEISFYPAEHFDGFNWIKTDICYGENNEKVFKLDKDKESINIIYDFNLITGDTIFQDLDFEQSMLITYNVDTIILEDNSIRKRLYLRKDSDVDKINPIIWIEGIGSIKNPFVENFYYDFVDVIHKLRCFLVSDVKVYSLDEECTKTDTKEISNKPIKIFPNPTSNTISIDIDETIIHIKISSLDGNVLLNSYEKELDISMLSFGFYIVQIETNTQHYHAKILKI